MIEAVILFVVGPLIVGLCVLIFGGDQCAALFNGVGGVLNGSLRNEDPFRGC